MASDREYLTFILEQLSGLTGVSYRSMMGEYILYYRGKIFGGIYDNRFLVKPVPKAIELLPDAPYETPYPGGKDLLLVEDVDNREWLRELIESMYNELPMPKKR